MLSKEDAKQIADCIHEAKPVVLEVDLIERNSKTHGYSMKCKYYGPTIKIRAATLPAWDVSLYQKFV